GVAPTHNERERVLQDLVHMAAREVPFVCANPDRRTVIGKQVVECVGTIAEYYEKNGGPVIWCGKPGNSLFSQAIARLHPIPQNRICVIGDSVETDIRGGNAAGLATALITQDYRPPGESDDGASPNYVLRSLGW